MAPDRDTSEARADMDELIQLLGVLGALLGVYFGVLIGLR